MDNDPTCERAERNQSRHFETWRAAYIHSPSGLDQSLFLCISPQSIESKTIMAERWGGEEIVAGEL